jgi:threonine/homoserine/homoserine lactone efflux protein
MLDTGRLVPYALAVLALVLAPGPNQALIIARSLHGGRRAGLTASLGINASIFVHTLAAAAGLSALLAASAIGFTVIKVAGALYLVYLGVRLLTGHDDMSAAGIDGVQSRPAVRGRQAFLRAMTTGVLNPKVAIFFLAFLPQFVDRDAGSVFWQFMILGTIFALIAITIDSSVAAVAGTIGGYLSRNPTVARWRERITGVAFIALGVRLAYQKR